LEFIEDMELKEPPNVRQVLYEQSVKFKEAQALATTKKIEEAEKKLKQKKPRKKKKNKD